MFGCCEDDSACSLSIMIPIKSFFAIELPSQQTIGVANQILSADSNHHLLLLSFLDAMASHLHPHHIFIKISSTFHVSGLQEFTVLFVMLLSKILHCVLVEYQMFQSKSKLCGSFKGQKHNYLHSQSQRIFFSQLLVLEKVLGLEGSL